ncbi:Sensory domain found in PocR [Carpediemonas membranifera]|uniref:histidine kinase n=1 Tax=Carpediemonas membranifera TaxID=201153 RepID=A0A8J6ARS2_9EUKA|nr:Sensory domain found in PocR [Carpediemonas membranifera]|eukprot:KAG9392338.1 Sensory domain found in PocR [Carpediemonas membranifera]
MSPTRVQFRDIIDDQEALNQLLNDAAQATQLSMIISGLDGKPLSANHRPPRICEAVRSREYGQLMCERSDAGSGVSPTHPEVSFTCHSVSYLHEGGTGIYLQDRMIAQCIVGGVRTEDEADLPEERLKQGEKLGLDRDWMKAQWEATQFMPLEEFDKRLKFMSVFTSQLSEAALVAYESGQLAANLQQTNQRLTAAKAELEEEVLAQTRHLAESNDALAASLETRRLFLGRVSHDMRTPLLGINGTAILMEEEMGRLQDEFDDCEMESNLSIMHTSCELLLTYIDQLLDFSRLEALEESGQPYVLEDQPMSMVEFLTSMTQLFEPMAAQKSITLTVDDKAIEADQFHRCDPLRLAQLLSNVIGNAMKFTPEGSRVTCTVELLGPGLPRMVDPECDVAIVDTATSLDEALPPELFDGAHVPAHYPAAPEGADLVAFSVSDTGPGIEEGRIYSIFSTFSQEDVSTPRVYGGSGLGLSMCRVICVDMYHGSLVVQNKPAGGALFVAILPLLRTHDAPEAFVDTISSSAAFQRHGIDFDRARELLAGIEEGMVLDPPNMATTTSCVLIVDDVEVNRIVIGRLLRSALRERNQTCRIHFASDGAEAIEKIQTQRYDLIFMDLYMPEGVSGYDAVKIIRTMEETNHTARHPVVAVTASMSGPEVEERCERDGFDGILGKPFKMEDLNAVLDVFMP